MKTKLLTFILFCFTLCSFAYRQVPLCSKCHKPKTACICKATPTPPQPAKCKQCGKTNCRTKDRHRVCPTCRQYDFKCRYNCKHPVENFVPEYVDLGLSVRWATCNVGATRPEEYGDYFAWGETETKMYYRWSSYLWCKGSEDTLTKYCLDASDGKVDSCTTLAPEDDAAHIHWGGAWRMPTEEELYELRTNCTWTWTMRNGVNGSKVTSKKNGKSIFFPAAGFRFEDNDEPLDLGDGCYILSSSLSSSSSTSAYGLYFNPGDAGWGNNVRCYGHSIRPVCP